MSSRYKVPEDVAVMGLDDIEFARIACPALTTIRQPLQEMGATAAELLFRKFAIDVWNPKWPPAASRPTTTGNKLLRRCNEICLVGSSVKSCHVTLKGHRHLSAIAAPHYSQPFLGPWRH